MPTALGHAMVGLGCGALAIDSGLPTRANVSVLTSLTVLAVVPDLDVIAFTLGIPYDHALGHRGLFHSLGFTAVLAVLLWGACRFGVRQHSGVTIGVRALIAFLIVGLSHPALDMMTNGGLGIAAFAPFSNERHFLPIRPIPVSPIGLSPRLYPIFLWELAAIGPAVLLAWVIRLSAYSRSRFQR